MRPERCLLICTLPRSGSYMLCDGLNQTGRLGYSAEYFSAAHSGYYEMLIGRDSCRNYDIVLDYALRIGRSPNGVFAAKILFHQLATLRQNYDACGQYPRVPPLPLLDRLLPRPHYVHLIRRDKLRQAISYHRAIASGVWLQFASQPASDATTACYDFAAISHWVRVMTGWESAWKQMLTRVNGPVLTLYYEDIVRDYGAAVGAVHDLLGIGRGPEVPAIRPALTRQSDSTTEDWVCRFTEDEAARGPALARNAA